MPYTEKSSSSVPFSGLSVQASSEYAPIPKREVKCSIQFNLNSIWFIFKIGVCFAFILLLPCLFSGLTLRHPPTTNHIRSNQKAKFYFLFLISFFIFFIKLGL